MYYIISMMKYNINLMIIDKNIMKLGEHLITYRIKTKEYYFNVGLFLDFQSHKF